jgi:hypothetical protein
MLASNSQFSSLSLPSPKIIGVYHHAQLGSFLMELNMNLPFSLRSWTLGHLSQRNKDFTYANACTQVFIPLYS